MKWVSKLLLLLLLGALAGAALAQEPVRIQLKWHHQFQFAGYYAALEQGYFAAEGLEVELLERDPLQNNIQQVLEGEAEYGIADSALLLYQQQGADIHIVAPIFQHSPNVLLTLASSGLTSPQDLVGRRIRLYENETEGFPIMAMLAEQGILERGFIRQPYTSDYGVLARRETDAIYAYSSNEPFRLREQGVDVHIIHPAHYGVDMYGDMLFTTAAEARRYPDRVAAMRRAVLRGWTYALDNKEELVDLILARYSQAKSREALLFEAHAIEQAVARFTVPLGTLDRGRLRHIAGIYQRHGLLDEHFAMDQQSFFDRPVGDSLPLTREERAFLQQHPVIRVAVDPAWFPMDFVDEHGQHAGIAADYLELLSQRLGVSFEAETGVNWTRAMAMVEARELDMFAMAANTPERSRYANFTRPYIRSPMVIVTRDHVDFIDGAGGLRGKEVAVVDGYASHEWLRNNHPDLSLRVVQTTSQGLEKVTTGEVYALVENLATASYLIKQQGLSNLKISGQMPTAFDLAIGVRSDWPELRNILQKGLDSITQQEREAIYNRWITLQMTSGIDWRRIAPYFIGLLILLALVSLDAMRVRRLHRRLRAANQQLHQAEQRLLQQNKELERLSTTDKLTGVYNRLKLDAELNRQLNELQRYARPVSLVMFDLDLFKQVNDGCGHQAGDQVLCGFSRLVLETVRHSDIFGRWGGEEFLLICPETIEADATELADKIRRRLSEQPMSACGTQTVSCGVAQWQTGDSLDSWIKRCDQRLYRAKAEGRNRVISR